MAYRLCMDTVYGLCTDMVYRLCMDTVYGLCADMVYNFASCSLEAAGLRSE